MQAPAQLDPKAAYLALSDPETLGTTLHIILLSTYGKDIYESDPVDLFLRLEEDFGVEKLPEELENRINAILMLTGTDLFYKDPDAFTAIAQTLADGDPGLDIIEPLTLPEILWSLYEAELQRGPHPMSKSVEKLVEQALEQESGDPETEDLYSSDQYGYTRRFLEEQRAVLEKQLEHLGLDHPDLPPVQPQNRPSLSLQ